MVHGGHALADVELLWPRGPAAAQPCSGEKPVLHDGAGLGPGSTGRPGRHGRCDCFAGADLRCLFCDQAGHTTGLSAAPSDSAHQCQGHRPDLPAICELGAVRPDRGCGGDVPVLQQSRCCLRHCRLHRHADHDRADVLRDPLQLELPTGTVYCRHRLLLRGGLCLLGIQPAQTV